MYCSSAYHASFFRQVERRVLLWVEVVPYKSVIHKNTSNYQTLEEFSCTVYVMVACHNNTQCHILVWKLFAMTFVRWQQFCVVESHKLHKIILNCNLVLSSILCFRHIL